MKQYICQGCGSKVDKLLGIYLYVDELRIDSRICEECSKDIMSKIKDYNIKELNEETGEYEEVTL